MLETVNNLSYDRSSQEEDAYLDPENSKVPDFVDGVLHLVGECLFREDSELHPECDSGQSSRNVELFLANEEAGVGG